MMSRSHVLYCGTSTAVHTLIMIFEFKTPIHVLVYLATPSLMFNQFQMYIAP
jgi:hypothetical protein